ncbi:MAG: DegT/DnrJ/EryC1/StrS family aminotransferase [Candidatus Ratteibacteria bacterium]|jgi:perosamine synthetase
MKKEMLAIEGGQPTRTSPWPARRLFGEEEKTAAIRLFDKAIEKGEAFGYGGEEEQAYCKEFCEFLNDGETKGFADVVNSGTNAVFVAIRALEMEPFGEIIVPPISDAGGVMPAAIAGFIPIPADTDKMSYNVGPEQIKERLSPHTRAIILAHIAGIPVDMDPIITMAKERNIPIIEDCAQAHGTTYKGKKVGTLGDIAAFSTMFGKHHATGGQGGIVYTRREELTDRIRRHADRGKPFGLPPGSGNTIASLNNNSDELSCAIGRVQLKKLPEMIARRRAFALSLQKACAEELKTVRVTVDPPFGENAVWFVFLGIDLDQLRVDKAQFVEALGKEGIPAGPSYRHLPNQWEWYTKRRVFGSTGYPWTCPLYKGNPDQEYPLPNALESDDLHFRLSCSEQCGEKEVADTVAALKKVETAYLR